MCGWIGRKCNFIVGSREDWVDGGSYIFRFFGFSIKEFEFV